MTKYANQIATATRLIDKFGAPCVWTKPAAAVAGTKPWRDVREGEPSTYPVSIAFFSAKDLGYGSTIALANMAGTEVPAHSRMGLMSGGLDFDPELTDEVVTAQGDELDITKVDTLAPDGEPILYFLWIA